MKKQEQALQIISFNIGGLPRPGSRVAKRYKEACRQLEEWQPDIINFQEVYTRWQLKLLMRALPSFSHVSYVSFFGSVRGGLVTFSKRPLQESKFIPWAYHKNSPTLVKMRSLLKGTLISTDTMQKGVILNTHLLANKDGDWSDSNRYHKIQQSQLSQLSNIVREELSLGKSSYRVILSGDFNVAKDSSLYTGFVKYSGLQDTSPQNSSPTFHKEFLPQGRDAHQIDYIFVLPTETVTTTRLLFVSEASIGEKKLFLSDHMALLAKVGPRESRLP